MRLAKGRVHGHEEKLFVGNAFLWDPPRRFDHVRTELCYVPEEYQHDYVERLLKEYMVPDGELLVTEYRSRKRPAPGPWIDDQLGELGFAVGRSISGLWERQELTRVAVIRHASAC